MLGDDRSVCQSVWSYGTPIPIERFLRLAAYYPDLLTFEEAELLAALEKYELFSGPGQKGFVGHEPIS